MKKIIASFIILVVVLILVFFMILPLWNSLGVVKYDLSYKETSLEQLRQRLDKVDSLKKQYRESESEAQKIFLALPKEEDIPNLLVQFSALASNNGLILESISFGQLSQGSKGAVSSQLGGTVVMSDDSLTIPQQAQKKSATSLLRDLSVGMNLTGGYLSFKNYLSDLAKNIRSMNVNNISFSPNLSEEGQQRADSYNFNLSVVVYYQ